MGSVIGKNAFSSLTLTDCTESTLGFEVEPNMTKSKANPEEDGDFVTCLGDWRSDGATHKYLDVSLRSNLEENTLRFLTDVDPSTAYKADIRLVSSACDTDQLDEFHFPSIESDCSRTMESDEEDEEDREERISSLEIENVILQDYERARSSRPLLSEASPVYTTSELSAINLVLGFETTVPNPDEVNNGISQSGCTP